MTTVKEIFETMNTELAADPSQAEGLEAIYQFNLSGDEEVTYQVILTEDGGKAVEGEQETPDCTLIMDSADFKKMADGELNGTEAFMSGQLQVEGDMGLALRLQDVLAAYSGAAE